METLNRFYGYHGYETLFSGYAKAYKGRFCNLAKTKLIDDNSWIISYADEEPYVFYDQKTWEKVYPVYIDDYIINKSKDIDYIGTEFASSFFQYCLYDPKEKYEKIMETCKFRNISELEDIKEMARMRLANPRTKKKIAIRLITLATEGETTDWI